MTPLIPLTRDLVFIGGGHAHALVLRKWAMAPVAGVRLTVINPDPTAPYTGMLPGHVAGHYARDDLEIDLVRLCRYAGARLILGRAEGMDPARGQVFVPGRAPISYDIAAIDIGITSDLPDLPGFRENAVAAKPLGRFAETWRDFVCAVDTGKAKPKVAVLGGGVAGVELALTTQHRLAQLGRDAPEITVIDHGEAMTGLSPQSRNHLLEQMHSRGLRLREHCQLAEIRPEGPVLSDGSLLPVALTIGAAGARPQPWLADTGLDLTDGFVTVDEHLQSLSHPQIYASGDCCHLSHAPRPKAGVFAVRAAPVLAQNLRVAVTGHGRRRKFRPQRSYLKLIALGPETALGQKGPFVLANRLMWRWKDHIDQAFMRKFHDLPEMAAAEPPREAAQGVAEFLAQTPPLCAGCGAKVGPEALSDVLAKHQTFARADLISAPGDDAAILQMGETTQVLSTDHLRAMTQDPVLLTKIALLHALGDVWAMGAEPQIALASVILPQMSEQLQRRSFAEITATAQDLLRAHGAELTGGHTTIGPELTLGFTVTGLLPRPALTLAAAQAGDAVILTRPLGSGVLMAAEMRRAAKGGWIAALWEHLQTSQAKSAALLAPVAHAMTDVTGFGLAGHGLNIARASKVDLHLDLSHLPLYDGALEMAAIGVRSSLYAANREAAAGSMTGLQNATIEDLLFDPQTCGGFLATIPANRTKELSAALSRNGALGAVIGHVSEQAEDIPKLRL
ncbi:MAG: selenide, water dikinase SelD [Mangrovicoccus sp.]